jgi:succinate dehydrogenase (ubiquinone) iron-sulfur subunit
MSAVARIAFNSVHAGGAFTTSLPRTFATSVARAQAVPIQKPVLNKEFKIYRWVRVVHWFVILPQETHALDFVFKNPDEPAKKPTLQTYTIDLNQCGPMVPSHISYTSHFSYALPCPMSGSGRLD